jgi:coatomer subunit beta
VSVAVEILPTHSLTFHSVGQSQFVKQPIDEDSVDRINGCLRGLAEFSQKKEIEDIFLEDSRSAFRKMVAREEKKRAEKEDARKAKHAVQVDDVLTIRQLAKKVDGTDDVSADLEKAAGNVTTTDVSSKLKHVVQLTGFSDPVYAEAYVNVQQVCKPHN